METLETMEPFLPSIAHELVRHSNYGASVSLRNKLSNVTTIKNIVQEISKVNFLTKMNSCNQDVIREYQVHFTK